MNGGILALLLATRTPAASSRRGARSVASGADLGVPRPEANELPEADEEYDLDLDEP